MASYAGGMPNPIMAPSKGFFDNTQNTMGGGGASNQFFPTLPQLPSTGAGGGPRPTAPGMSQVNAYSAGGGAGAPGPTNPYVKPNTQGVLTPVGHGEYLQASQDQQLTNAFNAYLQSMIGQGATPYGGKLTAPTLQSLSTIANEGISALPEWQAMIAAMDQNTKIGEANLKEQFAGMGGLAGSPFGNAISMYEQQTTLGQNALLGQLQQQNILQGQIPVAEFLQNYNQQGVQALYNEFLRTQPEYSPLLGLQQSMATTYAPLVGKGKGTGGIGALLGGAGGLASGIGDLIGALGIGGGAAAGGAAAGAASGEAILGALGAFI